MKAVAVFATCVLAWATVALAVEPSDCPNRITVNLTDGQDTPECVQGLSCSPCQTLSYVFENSSSLDHKQVVLQGPQTITHTLKVSQVKDLTIWGDGNIINCSHYSVSEDTGSGIVFESVTSLKVVGVVFEGCGAYSTARGNIKSRSAVHIINSTDVYISDSTFMRSSGRGLALCGVGGQVVLNNTHFMENTIAGDAVLQSQGGGVYITLEAGSRYLIKNCMFQNNRVIVTKSNSTERGGGIYLLVSTSDSLITLQNCTFSNNTALYGGGMSVVVFGRAHNNSISLKHCSFAGNSARGGRGGALLLGFAANINRSKNKVNILGTRFVNNSATLGGAVGLFTASHIERVQFTNCSWTGNSAFSGAALALYPSSTISTVPTATLESCSISGNILTDGALYLPQGFITVSGIVDVKIFHLSISGNTSFTHNKGTPLYAILARIVILDDSLVQFVNNSAIDGAGMVLYTYSFLQLSPGCKVLFDSNSASRLGGAIYAPSPHIPEFNYLQLCFLASSENVPSSQIQFTNNTATYGHSIFTSTIVPCLQQISGIGTPSFHWEGLQFSNVQERTISTSTAVISFTLPKDIAPGERVNLHLMTLDDFNQTVSSVLQIALTVGSGGQARTNPFIPDDGHLQVWGRPGTEFNLTLYVQYFRHASLTRSGLLGDCPLGLTLQGEECVCSVSIPGKRLVGVVECDMSNFQAHIQIGFWIGCTPANKVITGYCPLGYCNYNNISANHQSVPRACNALDEPSVLCVEQRRGVLCGECEDGYSVYFHSDNFGCGECPNGAVGLVYYVLAELFPLVILFVVIMVVKVKMTSGLMQSLLLFGQTVTFTNISLSPTLQSQTGQTLVRIHTFLLGFLNLDFFRLDELSFCLWSGATVLDNLTFRYVTTLFALLLLVVFVFIVKHSSSAPVRALSERFKLAGKLKRSTGGQIQFFNRAIVHGISAFLILSYTQYTSVSIQILSHLPLYGEGGINVGSVVRLQGSVESFGPDHIPYAIPALLVLTFLSLPPPLLLISYPLLWNIKAKLRQNKDNQEDKTPWLIRKLLPLIDSFQGVFRDNRRMFAGLLFLWRVMLAATFASAPNLTSFFFITEAILLAIFTIHVLARPYKRQLYNYIDTVMVANLAVINLLSWYISIITSEGGGLVVVAVAIKLVLMYAPLIVVVIFSIIYILRRCGVTSDDLRCRTIQEGDDVVSSHTSSKRCTVSATADEDLFSRAAEHNTSSYILTSSETGFELKETSETTRERVISST